MKSTILKYLKDLLEFEENSLVNIECDLLDSECVGEWKAEALKEKEKVKFRVNELQKCIKFLNEETVKRSELNKFLEFVENKTHWADDGTITNSQVIDEYLFNE